MRNLLNDQGVIEEEEIFTKELTTILNKTMAMKTIWIHPSNKPWFTPHIKQIIKDRQPAHSKGDIVKYKQLQYKAAQLISEVKLNYYQSKTVPTDTRTYQNGLSQLKASAQQMNLVELLAIILYTSSENLCSTADKLQDIFPKPWKDHIPKISSVDPDGPPDSAPK